MAITDEGRAIAQTEDHSSYAFTIDNDTMQIIGRIETKSDPVEHSFSISDHSGSRTTAQPFDDGSLALYAEDGESLGLIEAPWAVDAKGQKVPTRYIWEDGTLTQVVDHAQGTYAYPIYFDPEWSYAFTIGNDPRRGVANTTTAMKELRRCFNCSFPVSGAPKAFPKVGQQINLSVLVMGRAPVRVTSVRSQGFSFIALPGHFDGSGSTISFNFSHKCSAGRPQLFLKVNAKIKKDNGTIVNNANKIGARTTWEIFVARTSINAAQHQGVPKC